MNILMQFVHALPEMAVDVAIALSPIAVLLIIFQIFFLKYPLRQLLRMLVGIVYAFFGLVLFLVGVNVGFAPAGAELGSALGSSPYSWVLIPVGLIMGFSIVAAEPAVSVLTQQVEKVSGGAISRKLIMVVLCISMAIAVSLGMVRVLTGISLWWFIVPGYIIALVLLKFSPPIFSAIAFDSGGVASGPMTATFLLPLAVGAAEAIPTSNAITDAFGMVTMVAMVPLITIQILGVIYQRRMRDQELVEVSESSYAQIIAIVGHKQSDLAVQTAHGCGAYCSAVIPGNGTVSNEILSLFGLAERKYNLVEFLARAEDAHIAMHAIHDALQMQNPGHGIIFSKPILSSKGIMAMFGPSNGQTAKQSQLLHATHETEEAAMDQAYEMIQVIVKSGFASEAMEAAREAGADGGTIIHGRGAGLHENAKLFGVAIEPEKELLIVVVKKEICERVMLAISEKVGLDKPGHGMVFSSAVSHVMGIAHAHGQKDD